MSNFYVNKEPSLLGRWLRRSHCILTLVNLNKNNFNIIKKTICSVKATYATLLHIKNGVTSYLFDSNTALCIYMHNADFDHLKQFIEEVHVLLVNDVLLYDTFEPGADVR